MRSYFAEARRLFPRQRHQQQWFIERQTYRDIYDCDMVNVECPPAMTLRDGLLDEQLKELEKTQDLWPEVPAELNEPERQDFTSAPEPETADTKSSKRDRKGKKSNSKATAEQGSKQTSRNEKPLNSAPADERGSQPAKNEPTQTTKSNNTKPAGPQSSKGTEVSDLEELSKVMRDLNLGSTADLVEFLKKNLQQPASQTTKDNASSRTVPKKDPWILRT
ncbi:hypothetical protein B0J14DRAFT_156503 [Halenospora varia]|nr:hypothetical protein B0J14DRAFT_156503 [Halenospora varia]